jgi:hypothetical protein
VHHRDDDDEEGSRAQGSKGDTEKAIALLWGLTTSLLSVCTLDGLNIVA